MTETEKTSPAKVLDWLSLALKFVTMIEKLMPAFLISWTDYVRSQNKQLQTKLNYEKTKNEIQVEKTKQAEADAHFDAQSVINNFLNKQ
jgi:predicted negative regulator of RcsB-dependent stress response